MGLLAADAAILESGAAETRAEYEKHHLSEDIEFAKAVTTAKSPLKVSIEGTTAWVSSTSEVTGKFHERDVHSAGVELMVLSKGANGWQIRAIHWSSHAIKKAD